jgi:hypothetical protein
MDVYTLSLALSLEYSSRMPENKMLRGTSGPKTERLVDGKLT